MFSACRKCRPELQRFRLLDPKRIRRWAALLLLLWIGPAGSCSAKTLRVCADPNNLPFSNRAGEGFENHIAQLIANSLGADLQYRWHRLGRGFVREVLGKAECDLLVGIPVGFPGVLTTRPYYRSTYVFVARRDARVQPGSLDDQRLAQCRIAVQALDAEYSPPAAALARRGLQSNLVGFYTVGTGAAPMLKAVAEQQVDLAIVWGPLAGFAAEQFKGALLLTPIAPEFDAPRLPFTFQIAMGVRKSDLALRDELQRFLDVHGGQIREILDHYHVPVLPMAPLEDPARPRTITKGTALN
jgi:mxaJ protein